MGVSFQVVLTMIGRYTIYFTVSQKLLSAWDRAMLSRRFIIETINDQLKNITQIEHSRHRSVHGFMLNIIAGLIAYSLKDNKPSLRITSEEFSMMTVS